MTRNRISGNDELWELFGITQSFARFGNLLKCYQTLGRAMFVKSGKISNPKHMERINPKQS